MLGYQKHRTNYTIFSQRKTEEKKSVIAAWEKIVDEQFMPSSSTMSRATHFSNWEIQSTEFNY